MNQSSQDNTWKQSERRQHKRFPLTFYVSYIDPETENKMSGVYESYKDISLNGMFFKAKKQLTGGDFITINLTIPGFEKVFKIKCKIVRAIHQEDGNYNIGVTFIDMSPSDKKELEDFLKSFEDM